jgi:enoyl-CoA hydratase/carnithine racemase
MYPGRGLDVSIVEANWMDEQRSAAWHTLAAAALPQAMVDSWLAAQTALATRADAGADATRSWPLTQRFLHACRVLLQQLGERTHPTPAAEAATELIADQLRKAQTRFLRMHGAHVYQELTHNYGAFLRVAELIHEVSARYPDLVAAPSTLPEVQPLRQRQREGVALDQGIFIAEILRNPRAGAHLIQAMLRPKAESLALLEVFQRDGIVDLGVARVERHGAAGYLYHANSRYLNAEDEVTTQALEIGVDLILLDPQIDVGVLRGAVVTHPKYQGRRVFNAGLNLTHLYEGRIPFLFFITRDLGYLNKIYRGLAGDELWSPGGEVTAEKPWIGVVDAFAIGGGCQLLLIFDHVLAEEGSFFVLPAAKEGIIPGVANLRIARFLGGRGARRGIFFDQRMAADSPAGQLLCDAIIPRDGMEAAISAAIATFTQSGLISTASNRKLLRLGEEPLSAFQAYMAEFARDQAECYQSPLLVRNLEHSWLQRG